MGEVTEWEVDTLGNLLGHVIDFRGRTPLKLGMNWGGGEIPALSALNVKMGGIDFSRDSYFGSDALYRRWMTEGDAKRGDILFTMEAPLGNVAQVPDDRRYILSQRVVLLRLKPARMLNDFAALQLRWHRIQSQLVRWSTGTTATGIQRARLIHLPLCVPPLEEQRRIAEVLDTLDDFIRKTEELIAKLKQMKQGLLHDLLTRGVDDNGELRDPERHPEQFKDSPLGRIPKTWRVSDVGSLAIGGLINGVFKEPARAGRGLPLVNVSDLYAPFGIDTNSVERFDAASVERQRYSVQAGDVFFTRSSLTLAGIAQCNVVRAVIEPTVFECHIMRLRVPLEAARGPFVAMWCRGPWSRSFLMARAKQVTMTTISQPDVGALPVPLPNIREQEEIVFRVDALDARIAAETVEKAKMVDMKKGLMEDLLTGRVRTTVLEAAA